MQLHTFGSLFPVSTLTLGGGGLGMLWKGDFFCPYLSGFNRNDVALFGPDLNTGKKVGTDLVGAMEYREFKLHLAVTNQGAGPANFQILWFNPTTVGVEWPISGADPSYVSTFLCAQPQHSIVETGYRHAPVGVMQSGD